MPTGQQGGAAKSMGAPKSFHALLVQATVELPKALARSQGYRRRLLRVRPR